MVNFHKHFGRILVNIILNQHAFPPNPMCSRKGRWLHLNSLKKEAESLNYVLPSPYLIQRTSSNDKQEVSKRDITSDPLVPLLCGKKINIHIHHLDLLPILPLWTIKLQHSPKSNIRCTRSRFGAQICHSEVYSSTAHWISLDFISLNNKITRSAPYFLRWLTSVKKILFF